LAVFFYVQSSLIIDQQYFSVTTKQNQQTTSQIGVFFPLIINQHPSSTTSQPNKTHIVVYNKILMAGWLAG
jgi:hypothetical protein